MKDSIFDLIKERCDIVEVVSRFVQLKRVGSSYRGVCPFHFETEPSFFVSPQKGIWKCFGCGKGGDVIRFVAEIKGIGLMDAVAWLVEEFALNYSTGKNSVKRVENSERKEGVVEFPYGSVPLESVVGLPVWREVEDYAKRHKVGVEDMFKMGWRLWGNRLVIPCWDRCRSKLLYWVARSISDAVEPRYLNCSEVEKVVWGLDWFDVGDGVLYVCEGWKDAYRMRGIAVLGKGVTDRQVEMIGECLDGVKRVVIVFDRDAVKDAVKVAFKMRDRFKGVDVGVGVLDGLKDPGDAGSRDEVLERLQVFSLGDDRDRLLWVLRRC